MDEFFCCGQISVLHLYHIVQFVRKLIPAKLALSSCSTMIYHNVSISPSFTVSVSSVGLLSCLCTFLVFGMIN